MILLKGVASRGTTILCSLHQPRPRVLNLLDKVMLLWHGQVAYFGAPADAEAYFSSVGRPFPEEQPHPADAMLTLCCRGDGGALPALFERCPLVYDGVYRGAAASPGGVFGAGSQGIVSGEERSFRDNPVAAAAATAAAASHQKRQHLGGRSPFRRGGSGGSGGASGYGSGGGGGGSVCAGSDLGAGGVGGAYEDAGRSSNGDGGSGGGVAEKCGGRCWEFPEVIGGRFRDSDRGRPRTAGLLVQTEALSRRLLLRAVRHPLLLVLHFGGSVAMTACLGTIFQGKLDFTFEGAQSRSVLLAFFFFRIPAESIVLYFLCTSVLRRKRARA